MTVDVLLAPPLGGHRLRVGVVKRPLYPFDRQSERRQRVVTVNWFGDEAGFV
jgi:hypothetical protein